MEASVSETIRLDRWISDMTGLSRKETGRMIRKKRVSVNGEIVRDAAFPADLAASRVSLDGKEIPYEIFQYYMVNKPAGVLSATEDRRRSTVMDLLPPGHRRGLFPTGRLDLDTTGLILMTNDGQLAHRLLSPAWHVDKYYTATVDGILGEDSIRAFAGGITAGDIQFEPAQLTILGTDALSDTSWASVTIHEGKFHQIKKMFAEIGCPVKTLTRTGFGPLVLGDLPVGAARSLTEGEIQALRDCTRTQGKDHPDENEI